MSNLHNEIGSVRDDAAATRDVVTCPSCRTRWRVAQGAPTSLRCRCSRCDEVFSAGDAKTPYRVRLAPPGTAVREPHGTAVASAPVDRHGAPPVRDLRVGMDDPSLADRLGRTALHGGSDRKAWTWTVVADRELPEERSSGTSDVDNGGPETVSEVKCEAAIIDADPRSIPAETAVAEVRDPGDVEPKIGSAEEPGDDREELPGGPASLRESPLEPLIEALDRAAEPDSPATPAVAAAPADAPVVDELAEVVHDDIAEEAVDEPSEPSSEPDRERRPGIGTLAIVALLGAAGAMAAWTWTPWLTAAAADLLARWPATAGADVPADPSFWVGPGAAFGLLLGWGWLRWTLRKR